MVFVAVKDLTSAQIVAKSPNASISKTLNRALNTVKAPALPFKNARISAPK